jgi:hypothetical protein
MAKVAVIGHEEAAPVEEQPVGQAPGRLQLAASRRWRSPCASSAIEVARRMSSMRANEGPERVHMTVPEAATSSATSSVSRRDKASATVWSRPGWYSAVKS